jgi:Uma2 family endonuclease
LIKWFAIPKKERNFVKNRIKMTATTAKIAKIYTLAEYLAREERSAQKNEFYNGQIVPMPGSKYQHNKIALNVMVALDKEVSTLKNVYEVLTSDQKVYIEPENTTLYTDALVICGQPQFWQGREDLITNPIAVVEVLSKSTRRYDLTEKFLLYQLLPSFKEYITIEPYKAQVRIWSYQAPNVWKMTLITDLTQIVELSSMGISIKMADIYRNVVFKK